MEASRQGSDTPPSRGSDRTRAAAGVSTPGWGERLRAHPLLARVAIAVGLVVFVLAFAGSRPITEPDEGRYTAVALQMLKSGDWLTPRLHPEITHFTKPPLTYWAIAASLRLFGHSEWAARLPGALAFALTVLLVAAIAARLRERQPAAAALVYATCLLPLAGASVITTDTLLALWETLAAWGFVAAFTSAPPTRGLTPVHVMWLAYGLAFLTKGPPGLLPLLAFAAFAVATEGWRGLRRLASPLGLALFAAVGFSWYLAAAAVNQGLLSYLFWQETVARVSTATFDRNAQWYGAIKVYLPTVVGGCLPWGVLAFPRQRRALAQLFQRASWARWRRDDPPQLLLLLWIFIPFAVFVASRSRMPFYLLPLFVPLAVLMARPLVARGTLQRRRVPLAVMLVLLLAAVRIGVAYMPAKRNARVLATTIAAAVHEPIDEVVLVDARNWYGLSFYLGADVEHVGFLEQPGHFRDRNELLAHELAEPRHRRMFVVPAAESEQFTSATSAAGMQLEPVGELFGSRLYWAPGATAGVRPQERAQRPGTGG